MRNSPIKPKGKSPQRPCWFDAGPPPAGLSQHCTSMALEASLQEDVCLHLSLSTSISISNQPFHRGDRLYTSESKDGLRDERI